MYPGSNPLRSRAAPRLDRLIAARGRDQSPGWGVCRCAVRAGAASRSQAQALRDNLPLLERAGGLQTSTCASGAQWDAPFGRAPINWLAVSDLAAYRHEADARRSARKLIAAVDHGIAHDGTIREKYNMAAANADVKITAGCTQSVTGFGWTPAVYLKTNQLLRRH